MDTVRVLLIDGGSSPAFPLREEGKNRFLERVRITRKTTLAEGLDALQTTAFQLILLDCSLSGVSSTEAVKRVLAFAKDVPVITLVDEQARSQGTESIALGAEDFVLKGCHCGSLARAMEYTVGRKQLLTDVESDRARLAQDRERLTAHLSHELRNSLACIHQFGNILIDGLAGQITEEQREYIGIMLQNARGIRSVVDSLLEVAPANPGGHGDAPELPAVSHMAN